ncbi:Ig lambda chain V-V region DEL, partial [Sciurus carolinensis]|nr:Ig lambda chain V-V region DEL [Sciurus carolinensis]
LTNSFSRSVFSGHRATITCSGDKCSDAHVHWYQQKPAKSPVLVIYEDSNCASAIPDSLTLAQGTKAILTIIRVQVGDEADYYF